ncbi:hypothetical protein SOASR030_37390 [Leminorella grimontii]|uniref:Protein of uncharacterized function (DUF2730) n=2 Tax=Leminorella TaxID=82980 RepID=A0A2X4U531_9GAMM|nr:MULTISPECIES: DUF2730 family protein [Leminorella]GKX57627.1 hypothetical protein SOASR030_37390 [Leminorella grimontii]SQI34957.1 Protein of uncharacterised function (DUF2730) [Leminorella richardii]VFS54592.1 Protein of uncharacterised function (DUF2730) [Leminorella grimontii]VFS55849.1 Protein of uncharacterised function (DUF2730) [Leminorella grimontii]
MFDFIATHWSMVWSIGSAIVICALTVMARTYAKRDDVELLKTRMNALEKSLSSLPNQKELHALQLDMANLRGDLKAALPELRNLRNLSDLLLQNELKEKK